MKAVPRRVLPTETRGVGKITDIQQGYVIIQVKSPRYKVNYAFHHQVIITDCIDKQIIERENTGDGKQNKNQIIYQVKKHISRSCPVFFPVRFFIKLFGLSVRFFLR